MASWESKTLSMLSWCKIMILWRNNWKVFTLNKLQHLYWVEQRVTHLEQMLSPDSSIDKDKTLQGNKWSRVQFPYVYKSPKGCCCVCITNLSWYSTEHRAAAVAGKIKLIHCLNLECFNLDEGQLAQTKSFFILSNWQFVCSWKVVFVEKLQLYHHYFIRHLHMHTSGCLGLWSCAMTDYSGCVWV